MSVDVRPMTLEETGLIINYFCGATPEHLEMLGVDPTRLPPVAMWRERFEREFALPIEHRRTFMVSWIEDGQPVGFSTVDKTIFGETAHMHLHVSAPRSPQPGPRRSVCA